MDASAFADDGFGGQNSVLVVRKPGEGGGADSARLDALKPKLLPSTPVSNTMVMPARCDLESQWQDKSMALVSCV